MGSSAQIPLATVNSTILEQPANQMLLDSMRGQLLITIPSSDQTNGNSLGIIDPEAAELVDAFGAGTEPHVFDLSHDLQYAYIGLANSSDVVKMDLNTHLVVQTIEMGVSGGMLPLEAKSIGCHPNNSDVIAVSRQFIGSTFTSSMAIFDAGVQRPAIMEFQTSDFVRFKANDPDRVVGLTSFSGSGELRTYASASSGITFLNQLVLSTEWNDLTFQLDGDTAFADDGSVFDLSADQADNIGAFALPSSAEDPHVCVDRSNALITFAYHTFNGQDTLYLMRYSRASFLPVDVIKVPGVFPQGAWGSVVDLVCWGPNTQYAANLSNDRIVIIDGVITTSIPALTAPLGMRHDGHRLWLTDPGSVRIELFDSVGRQLAAANNTNSVDISGLSAGTYSVRAWNENRSVMGGRFALVR